MGCRMRFFLRSVVDDDLRVLATVIAEAAFAFFPYLMVQISGLK